MTAGRPGTRRPGIRAPGGGEPATVLLVRGRAAGGLAAHVDHEARMLHDEGVTVRHSDAEIGERPRPRADTAAVRTLHRESRRPGTLVVHAHGLRAGALAALALLARRSPRLVVTLHNRVEGGSVPQLIGTALLRLICRRADTVLAVSPDLARAARRAGARDVRDAVIPAPPHTPAPPATDPPRAPHADPAWSPDQAAGLRVLVIARLAPQKDFDTLADALGILRARGVAVQVAVAGEGPERAHLEQRRDREDLPLRLLGHRADVPELLQQAQLVVSSARWEGQPVALQQALRAGRAVVATDAGGTRWVTGDAAPLVPVEDAAALADAIEEMTAPDLRTAAEERSRARAARLPGETQLRAQLQDVLGRASADTHGTRARRW
ncbi:glycosyltransferase [Brachybacterium sp. EF45031]|uniref:glycosyltransferase n=1 Tax=Brachybacterium sillae TaxID=2810536 RepID=UPI00217D4CBE|nr:glycosyltransferase [Brachybacterium sillae]MCS6712683.1 glycosyltransferase [Brachybacterium sillae]